MGQQIEELARFAAETRMGRHPGRGAAATPNWWCWIRWALFSRGRNGRRSARCVTRLAASAGSGATVYGRGWPANDPRTAALLNGIAGRSIELCEGLRLVSGQAAVQILPGVLAVGEAVGAPARR